MTYFWVITLMESGPSKFITTVDGHIDSGAFATPEEAFRQILAEAKRKWRETTSASDPMAVLSYSLEPDGMTVRTARETTAGQPAGQET